MFYVSIIYEDRLRRTGTHEFRLDGPSSERLRVSLNLFLAYCRIESVLLCSGLRDDFSGFTFHRASSVHFNFCLVPRFVSCEIQRPTPKTIAEHQTDTTKYCVG